MNKSSITALLASIITVSAGLAFAHGGATGIVKQRMDAMVDLGKSLKLLSSMTKSDGTFDTNALDQAVATLRQHSGKELTDLFPEGSTPMVSEARETIWTDWDGFVTLADQMSQDAQMLETVQDKQALGVALSEIGQTCKACHAEYRLKK